MRYRLTYQVPQGWDDEGQMTYSPAKTAEYDTLAEAQRVARAKRDAGMFCSLPEPWLRFGIYAEQCIQKGKLAADADDIDQYREENDGQDCQDWWVIEGTPAGLLALADVTECNARSGGGGTYDRRCAATIREYVEYHQ